MGPRQASLTAARRGIGVFSGPLCDVYSGEFFCDSWVDADCAHQSVDCEVASEIMQICL